MDQRRGRSASRPVLRVGVVASVVLLTAVACGGPPRGQHVLVVGDSITRLLADDFAQRDGGRFDFTVRALDGATSVDMLPYVREVDDVSFGQVVIDLGTNDVVQDVGHEATVTAIEEMIDLFPTAECIHLVTVNEHRISPEGTDVVPEIQALNASLHALADAHEQVRLIDWSSEVGAYLDDGEPDGPLTWDTVHPTELGQQKLIQLEVEQLKSCGRWPFG